jgi:hypothetical protein
MALAAILFEITLEVSRPCRGGRGVISLASLSERVRRLEELTLKLAREVQLWKACDDPLLNVERRAYLKAIQDALAGLDEARVILVQAQQRHDALGSATDGNES